MQTSFSYSEHVQDTSKPRFELFYEIRDEAYKALESISLITLRDTGIEALIKELKKRKIKLAFGSLRLDKDEQGTVFMKEYRPSSSLFQRGYFHAIKSDRPFWEIFGTALIRLARKLQKHEIRLKKMTRKGKKDVEYCVILQGDMEKEYIKMLLEQGRVSYDTSQIHLREEPIFSALSILSRLKPEQIVEVSLQEKTNPEHELRSKLLKLGKSFTNVACLVGLTAKSEFYTAPHGEETEFPVTICNHKVIPVEVANVISAAEERLISKNGLLVLDDLPFARLEDCLENKEKYYYDIA